MTEIRPAAVRHDAEYYRAQRVPSPAAPIGEQPKPAEIKPPRVAHFAGPHRPIVTTSPATPIRLTRGEIERALEKSFTYHPNQQEIVDRILLETSRMDGFAENSPPFREHHETILRLLREIGLYPL
jgi:hypothetical protein